MDTYQAQGTESRSLGERIREVRAKRGLTLAELASQADISRTHLWQLEGDRSRPGVDVLSRIAQALGVEYATLMPQACAERQVSIPLGEETVPERPAPSVETATPAGLLAYFLQARASASQKAARYAELSYPWVDYRVAVDYVDRFRQYLKSEATADQCAEFILEATKEEGRGQLAKDGTEKRRHFEQAIEAYRHARDHAQNADVAAYIDWNLGNLFADMYSYERALDHLFRALGRLEHRISDDDAAWIQTTIGYLSYRAGRYQTAIKYFIEAIDRSKGAVKGQPLMPEKVDLAARRGLGSTYERLGKFQDATSYLEEACRLAAENHEEAELAWATARLGFLHIHTGQWTEAEKRMAEADAKIKEVIPTVPHKRSLQILQEIILSNYALLRLRQGKYSMALEHSEASLHMATEQLHDLRGEAFCHMFAALIYAAQDNQGKALEHIQNAENQFRSMGIRYYMPEIKALQAEIYCKVGLKPAAMAAIDEAVKIVMDPERGSDYEKAIVQRISGLVYAADHDEYRPELDKAEGELRESVAKLEKIGEPYELAQAYHAYGQILAKQGQSNTARERFQQALDIARKLKAEGIRRKVEKEMERLPV